MIGGGEVNLDREALFEQGVIREPFTTTFASHERTLNPTAC